MTPSKILFLFSLSFIVGVSARNIIKISHPILWGFLIFSALFTIFSFLYLEHSSAIRRVGLLLSFCLLFIIIGIVRFEIAEHNIFNDKLRQLNDTGQEITVIGQVADEPDIRINSQKLLVKTEEIIVENQSQQVEGLALITMGRNFDYEYSDKIVAKGKLKTPFVTDEFNYKNYLMKDGIYSVMDFPETELLVKKNTTSVFREFYSKILAFKNKLRESIVINFPPPQSFILEGMLLGSNKTAPKDLQDKLSGLGVRHLTAISGLHIVILSSILMSFLIILGFWRSQAFYAASVLIWLYIILVGFPASGVRAAIMGTVFLLAQKLGRANSASRMVILAGAVMLWQNPLILFYDIGFQLSFLAVLGIINLKPVIDGFLGKFLPEKSPLIVDKIRDIFSVTLAATIFTLPIVVYNFGTVPLLSPLVNILILPVVPLIMGLGFLAVLLGVFWSALAMVFYAPVWFLLTYFFTILDIFYQPWAVKKFENLSFIWVLVYYLVLIIFLYFFRKSTKSGFVSW